MIPQDQAKYDDPSLSPTYAMIIRNEEGAECQRLIYHWTLDTYLATGRLDGVYSMESDMILLKHRISLQFFVIHKERSKSYPGELTYRYDMYICITWFIY